MWLEQSNRIVGSGPMIIIVIKAHICVTLAMLRPLQV